MKRSFWDLLGFRNHQSSGTFRRLIFSLLLYVAAVMEMKDHEEIASEVRAT